MALIKSWEWYNLGVDLYDDHLTWWEKEGPVRFASGAARDQTFEEFAQEGPVPADFSPEIVAQVREAVREHLAKRAG